LKRYLLSFDRIFHASFNASRVEGISRRTRERRDNTKSFEHDKLFRMQMLHLITSKPSELSSIQARGGGESTRLDFEVFGDKQETRLWAFSKISGLLVPTPREAMITVMQAPESPEKAWQESEKH
jgi:hypothetical protein